jgi:hypothetical protein
LRPRAEIRHEARDGLEALSLAASVDRRLDGFSSRLSWTHYRTLTKVEQPEARAFYEIEAALGDWSVPYLERQIHTQLAALGAGRSADEVCAQAQDAARRALVVGVSPETETLIGESLAATGPAR